MIICWSSYPRSGEEDDGAGGEEGVAPSSGEEARGEHIAAPPPIEEGLPKAIEFLPVHIYEEIQSLTNKFSTQVNQAASQVLINTRIL